MFFSDISTCKKLGIKEISDHSDMFLRIQLIISFFCNVNVKRLIIITNYLKPISQSIHHLHAHAMSPLYFVCISSPHTFFFCCFFLRQPGHVMHLWPLSFYPARLDSLHVTAPVPLNIWQHCWSNRLQAWREFRFEISSKTSRGWWRQASTYACFLATIIKWLV